MPPETFAALEGCPSSAKECRMINVKFLTVEVALRQGEGHLLPDR